MIFQFSLWVRVFPLSSLRLFSKSVCLLHTAHEEPFVLYVDTFSCMASVGLCAPSGWVRLGHRRQLPGKATVKAVLKLDHTLQAPFQVLDLLTLIGPFLFPSPVCLALSGSQSSALPPSCPDPILRSCVALAHGFCLRASNIYFPM